MNQTTETELNNAVQAAYPQHCHEKTHPSLADTGYCETDPPTIDKVDSERDEASAGLEAYADSLTVTSDNITGKYVLVNEDSNTASTVTSIVPSSDNHTDHNEESRSFSELRALFSQGNLDRRPNSPGMDLTPVKEQCLNNQESNQSIESNNNNTHNGDTSSGMESNFQPELSKNSNILESSRVNKSFDIDLENCVTRDCVTRDLRDHAPCLQNGNSKSNGSSLDTDIVSITTTDQQSTCSTTSPVDALKKTYSYEICFDDFVSKKTSPNRRNKTFGTKFKTLSREPDLPSKENPINNGGSSEQEENILNSNQTSSSAVLPSSIYFEINSENSTRCTAPRNTNLVSSRENSTDINKTRQCKMSGNDYGVDGVNVKETRTVFASASSNEQKRTSNQCSIEKSTSGNTLPESRATPYHNLDAFPEKECSEPNPVSTSGISFDVSFDDNSPTKKTRLAPKHIRLKMSQAKRTNESKITKQSAKPDIKVTSPLVTDTPDKVNSPSLTVKTDATKRDTYTLDEVSQTLQDACEKGQTLEQALDNLEHSHHPPTSRKREPSTSTDGLDTVISKRGTYSLDDVSKCLVDAANNGQTVTQALESLAQEPNTIEVNEDVNPKRGTYDLNDVSRKIDSKKNKGNTLEQALEQLLNEVESAVHSPNNIRAINRDTYDLESVSLTVQNLSEHGVPVEESLNKISSHLSDENIPLQEPSVVNNTPNTTCDTTTAEKRGTYSLDDIAKQLDSASEQATSVIDTLSNISRHEASTTKESGDRNTYTLDEVAQSLEVAKTKGIPVVQALSNISSSDESTTPGSRGTYPLDEVAESLESARKKGLPVVMALENLVTHDPGRLKGPADAAVLRRQGKLTNRKTYALASPLETIGEDNQLRLFDGTSRKFLPVITDPMSRVYSEQVEQEEEHSSGKHVMKTLDLLTSACEALLKSRNNETEEQSHATPIDSKREKSETGMYLQDEGPQNLKTVGGKEANKETPDSLTPARKHFRIPRAIRKGSSKSETSLYNSTSKEESNRQTYSLDSVSNSVEIAKEKGIPVIAALDELTVSLAQFSATGAKALKNSKKPIKKPDRPSIRKRQSARVERSGIKSEITEDIERPKGNVFPISYPPAMRNSYSLDDVASAFEMAYKTGASFQDFLYGGNHPESDNPITKSTGTLKTSEKQDLKLANQGKGSGKTCSSMSNESTSSSSEDHLASHPRKNSSSSEGGLSCSSSTGSDLSANKDSSMEDLGSDTTIRKQRKRSNGPFQLRRTRRGLPASLPNVTASQDNSVKSVISSGSKISSSDTDLPKRGTYDLKQVSKELDSLKDQGVPVVKGLDKLVTSESSITKRGTYNFDEFTLDNCENKEKNIRDDPSMSLPDPNSVQSASLLEDIPKRNTFILEDDDKSRKSAKSVAVNKAVFELSHRINDTATRNTFTLDHVEDSIEDAHTRGIPVVDVLDKLSTMEVPQDNKEEKHIKAKLRSFTKPQTKVTDKDEFFIEYFPSKTEEKSPRYQLENGEAVEKHVDKRSELIPDQDINTDECIHNSDQREKSFNDLHSTDSKVQDQKCESAQSKNQLSLDKNLPRETELESDVTSLSNEDMLKDIASGGCQTSDSRPRWQRSGSYVEALDSFEHMLGTNKDSSKVSNEPGNAIHTKDSEYNSETKDSEYNSETYDTMVPETRSRWRPSGSVLGQILSLMDNAEEKGLSIADALEQAAELSEKQGEIDESKSDDVEQDTASPQHRALSLQFEEKRRQIEAEKHRSQEQWDEERRRLDETAFWYTIGRAKSTDKNAGNVRPDHEKIECLSPGQPTPPIGRSTPFECLSPLLPKPGYQSPTVERSQSPGNHVEPSIGHGYHQAASVHRPGLGLGLTQTGHQSPVSSQTGFQFPSTNFQTGQPVSQHEGERDIYQQQQEFETRQFLFSEYTSQGNQHQELTPSSPSQITKSPVRKCWEVNPPAATTVFTPPSPEGVALHVEEDEQDDNEDQLQNKKGFSMFIGDEAEKPKEGLTPEQQKKRDRFLKSRQKKQEEEKVRKDVENEKKRLREIKQKELEEQKRIEEDQKRHEHQRRLKRDSMGSSGESSYRPGANQHDDISAFNEFSGPRCYVKPSGKSNRKLIINAISHVCLSGTVNKENKEKCLQAIAESPGCHFIVLFKDGLKFRGLYMLHPETEQGFKIFGIGPKVITSKMVDCVYKYGSGGKEFTKIASKSLSISVDGIAILKSYWQSNKPNVASKTQSNLKRPPRPPQR